MPKTAYNQCVGDGLRGKQLSKEDRKRLFCVLSKTCSGKAQTQEEANEMCENAPPKEPKARKSRAPRRGAGGGGGMRLVLLTTTNCKPCAAAKAFLAPQLEAGLIEEWNVQKSDEAADLAAKHGFLGVPKLLVLNPDGTPFSELQITDTEQLIVER